MGAIITNFGQPSQRGVRSLNMSEEGRPNVSNKSGKIVLGKESNRASILLFFKDGDEIIARNWQPTGTSSSLRR